MNEKLKQRLVGAVVLVSLAVIFIPMLLDGGEPSSMPAFGSNIPEKPDYKFEPLDIPLQPVSSVPEERPVLIDKAEPAPEKPAAEKDKSKSAPSPTTASSKPAQSQPAAPAKPNAATPSNKDGDQAWVVQVGSFSESTNALSLRDKLREKGFTAFVERLKAEGDTIYRVRIGPELKRDNAEKQRKRLHTVMGMNGIVMGHK